MKPKKHIVAVSRTRVGPHARLCQVWKILVASLGVDAVLIFVAHGAISETTAQGIAAICAVITIPFLDQRRLAATMSQLRNLSKANKPNTSNRAHWALFISISLLLASKFILLPSTTSVVGLIFTGVVIVGVLLSIKRALEENRLRAQQLKDKPTLQITIWESQLVAVFLLPLIAARLISLVGALTTVDAQASATSAACFIASALLLLCLRPDRRAFIGMCAACKSPVPIAFVEYGRCPACDKELRAL